MDIVGTEAADTLSGTADADQVAALAGGDVVHGFAGDDGLDGGSGDDQLFGDDGADDLYGGNGRDILQGGAGDDQLYGGDGSDTLAGGAGADLIYGGDGIDAVDYSANSGAIAVDGGRVTGGGDAGGDVLNGIESVIGTAFADALRFTGASVLDGRAGNDSLSGGDTLLGGDGNDQLSDGRTLRGGAGDDVLTGLAGNAGNLLYGDGGNDTLNGLAAVIDGGAGLDTYKASLTDGGVNLAMGYVSFGNTTGAISGVENVTVAGEHVRVVGSVGANVIDGAALTGDNMLIGGAGDDTITGGGLVCRFSGGTGADHFSLKASYNYLYYDTSSAGVDIDLAARHFSGGDAEGDSIALTGTPRLGVIGSAFADTIRASDTVTFGLDADNLVSGGGGDDRLIAGGARDALVGGSGADVFVYESTSDIGYFDDRITDFSSAQGDKIDLHDISGELSWYTSGAAMIVRIYVDRGYHYIQLDNVIQLSLSDFIL